MKRRRLLKGGLGFLGATSQLTRSASGMEFVSPSRFHFHDQRGDQLLLDTLDKPEFWVGSAVTQYAEQPFDEIRIQEDNQGLITFITGTGRSSFQPRDVSETIFEHQDLIPLYMSRLKVGEYFGRGIDGFHGFQYTDMYFLADIKILYMSVPLRTVQIPLGDGRYLCPIELVTERMLTQSEAEIYAQKRIAHEQNIQDGWTVFPVVPMEYLVGYYLVEPEENFGARVSMVTRMKFKENISWAVDWGSELHIVLRQGMIAGFMGSVHACQHVMQSR